MTNADKKVIGIVSERDYVSKVGLVLMVTSRILGLMVCSFSAGTEVVDGRKHIRASVRVSGVVRCRHLHSATRYQVLEFRKKHEIAHVLQLKIGDNGNAMFP